MLCALFSRARASTYADAMGTDLSSVLDSVQNESTRPCSNSTGLPHVRPDGPALYQGCWLPQGLIHLASLGRWERWRQKERVTRFCRGHPSPGTLAIPP